MDKTTNTWRPVIIAALSTGIPLIVAAALGYFQITAQQQVIGVKLDALQSSMKAIVLRLDEVAPEVIKEKLTSLTERVKVLEALVRDLERRPR